MLIQDIDPNAAMTWRDVEEMIADLDINQIRVDMEAAKAEIEGLRDELEETAGGFVKNDGDGEIKGELKADGFIGDLEGSAVRWNGWMVFESLGALSTFSRVSLPPATVTLKEVVDAMPARSELIDYLSVKNSNMPGVGILEVRKLTATMAVVSFRDTGGRAWAGVYASSWKGWGSQGDVPVGTILPYDGAAAPADYVLLRGQWLNMADYPELYKVVQGRYGVSGAQFRVQDARGVGLRGLDAGRGLDPGRSLGSYQGDGVPNIYGCYGGAPNNYGFDRSVMNGAFYVGSQGNYKNIGSGGADTYMNLMFDASRAHSVYGAASEVRVKNVAVNFIQKAR